MLAKKVLLSQLIFVSILGISTAAVFLGLRQGLPQVLILNVVILAVFAAVMWLEKAMPFRPDWNEKDPQTFNDVGHLLFGTGLGAIAGDALTKMIFASAGVWLAQKLDTRPWPQDWPLPAQILLVFLLAEFGRYWQHRLMHTFPRLWQFHRLHHSIDRMGILKTSRSHIIERIFQPICMFGFLILMGVPSEVMLFYIIPNSFLGVLDHSNIDLRLGWMEYLVMGPAGHRLHHSQDRVHGNSNFGSALLFWDFIFGTFTNPLKTQAPTKVGISNDPMPKTFFAQIQDGFGVQHGMD